MVLGHEINEYDVQYSNSNDITLQLYSELERSDDEGPIFSLDSELGLEMSYTEEEIAYHLGMCECMCVYTVHTHTYIYTYMYVYTCIYK